MTKGSDDSVSARVVGSMVDYIWAGKNAQGSKHLMRQLVNPETRICTLTVTEKGYNCNLTTGLLDMEHPANNWMLNGGTLRDLQEAKDAKAMSAIGYLVGSLSLIAERRQTPFTVLSCDNL